VRNELLNGQAPAPPTCSIRTDDEGKLAEAKLNDLVKETGS
jgi:hypothetical protein